MGFTPFPCPCCCGKGKARVAQDFSPGLAIWNQAQMSWNREPTTEVAGHPAKQCERVSGDPTGQGPLAGGGGDGCPPKFSRYP